MSRAELDLNRRLGRMIVCNPRDIKNIIRYEYISGGADSHANTY